MGWSARCIIHPTIYPFIYFCCYRRFFGPTKTQRASCYFRVFSIFSCRGMVNAALKLSWFNPNLHTHTGTHFTLFTYFKQKFPDVSKGLAVGALLLTISMFARSVDLPLCEIIPTGTHFLWHVINAIMLAWMIEVYRRHIISRTFDF